MRVLMIPKRNLLILAALGIAGCAQWPGRPVAVVAVSTPARSAAPAPTVEPQPRGAVRSLPHIVNDLLQHGHFAEGRRALRDYLKVHPGDRDARALLHQLTVDPKRMLGAESRPYTVRAGDSYSALAARYLGDASRFVVLARYNGSDNPSDLQVGQTLQLPVVHHASKAPASSPVSRQAAPKPPSKLARARTLQRDSVALAEKGHHEQALSRLDQALTLDPRLPSGGGTAAALRKQLLASYHERAIVLYRDQKLDQAIALWDRLLSIDPGYEPAQVYRARARELKRRLKQL
jgi:tetratricopeptide (TPR) repeat protein